MTDIYLQITETPTVVTLSAPVVSGALSSTVTVANTVTVALDSNSLSALENVTVTVGAAITGTVTVSNFPASQTVTFSAVTISNFPATQAVSLASVPTHGVTLASTTVTISSIPAISGTVTANALVQQGFDLGEDIAAGMTEYGGIPISGTVLAIGYQSRELPIEDDGETGYGKYIPIGYRDEGNARIVDLNQPLPIRGTVTIGSALPTGTNRIGVVTIGAGTVTIGAGTAQIGSVTASISGTVPVSGTFFQATQPASLASLPALAAGTNQIGSVTASISGTVPISISSVTVGNSVTIGSLPAISGTVTANLAISSSAITCGSFTSLTSATLVPGNTARKMATVYNLGAGQLFVNAGASATTLGGGFMVALSSGDFYECDYTTTTISAIFATAGTASWVSH